MPWRNGGGSTRELVRAPAHGGFDWRLSVAEVADAGPFSAFDGYDRIIWLLSGTGMDLHFGAHQDMVALRARWQSHRFAGEQSATVTLPAGSTTDLNLIWRRSKYTVTTARVDLGGPTMIGRPASLSVVFVAAGTLLLADGAALHIGDAATWRGAEECSGDATVLGHHLVALGG